MQEYIEFASNNPKLTLAWFAIAGYLIYLTVNSLLSNVKSVNNQQAITLINKEDAVIVDVRSAEEFRKGHIVNALNLPLEDIDANKVALIEKYKNTPIIVVCESGMRSSGSAKSLTKMDFTTVYNLSGGIAGWKDANLPTVKK